MRTRVAGVLIVAAAALAAFLPGQGAWVERHYARGVFPGIQTVVTAASNAVPFAALDLLVTLAAVLGVFAVASVCGAPRGRRWAMAARRGWQAAIAGALVYLAFLAAWGFNYRRQPVSAWLDFDERRLTPDAVVALNETAVVELGRLRPHLPEKHSDWPRREIVARSLVPALDQVTRLLGLPSPVVPGRPKTSMLDPYLTRAGVSGMTDPFFLETVLASNLLPFEYAAVIAHEWGHLAGLAREADASFFGLLVCLHGDEAAQYSAWLEVYLRTLPARDREGRIKARMRLPLLVRGDLDWIAKRADRDQVRAISLASWRAYDSYLRSNGVTGGVRNYGEVVRLMVGTRFDPGWRPVLHPQR